MGSNMSSSCTSCASNTCQTEIKLGEEALTSIIQALNPSLLQLEQNLINKLTGLAPQITTSNSSSNS